METQGEVAALKDNINQMIRNLKDTTLKNSEQDWLKTNLAKFSRMLQGQKDLITVGRHILSELAPVVGVQQALFYTYRAPREDEALLPHPRLTLLASYASEGAPESYEAGAGLIGQCAVDKAPILLQDVPDDYLPALNALDDALEKAVDAGDERSFRVEMTALLDAVRDQGDRCDDDSLQESDLVLPPADATLEEVRVLLGTEGLIPD